MYFVLGVLPFEGDSSFSHVLSEGRSVGVFVKDLSSITNKETLKLVLDVFSILAMLTSVFGVAIGLYDYLLESLKNKVKKNLEIKSIVLTLGVPLVFSILYK